MQNIFEILGPAQLAPIIGVSRQRVHAMLRNLDRGDNRERINKALLKIAGLIETEVATTVQH